MQAEAEHIKREESLQSEKQKRTRDQPAYLRQEINKRKTVKTIEAKNFSKSDAELVDFMVKLQHTISIIEKEIAKNPAFLQKEIETRNTNNATVALINSLHHTVSMMRRTTEQINDQFFLKLGTLTTIEDVHNTADTKYIVYPVAKDCSEIQGKTRQHSKLFNLP